MTLKIVQILIFNELGLRFARNSNIPFLTKMSSASHFFVDSFLSSSQFYSKTIKVCGLYENDIFAGEKASFSTFLDLLFSSLLNPSESCNYSQHLK